MFRINHNSEGSQQKFEKVNNLGNFHHYDISGSKGGFILTK